MEEDGQEALLVVDEKETCVAHFVPEDKFEHIWNQESQKYDENPSSEEENVDKSTIELSEKVKDHQNELLTINSDLDSENEKFYDSDMKTPESIANKFDEIVQKKGRVYRNCFGNLYTNISSVVIIITSLMVKLFGNRWAWNIFMVVTKISVAVFLYLVIAVSTAIIAIIFNVHDAYVQLKLERNEKYNISEKLVDSCKEQTAK